MNQYFDKWCAEVLSEQEARESTSKTWYLPHHGVESSYKPGKVCVVYDAAAEYGGVALNTELLQGPDLNNNLVGVLLRFRHDGVALVVDVEGMFNQFLVPRDD
jgi:hypothetical protein